MIIDDASNYEYVSSHYNLVNCFIIQSEFPGSGELLGYYYFHKYRLFEKAIVIHDSSFLNGILPVDDIHTARFIWHFSHEWNTPSAEIELINILHNSDFLLNIHRDHQLWKGAFGTQSVITYDFLDTIVKKYNLFHLFQVVKRRIERCHLERIFGLICCAEDPQITTRPSIMGLIHDCEDFGTVSFERYTQYFDYYSHLVIIKTWAGR
jgi:hypothetical protein